MRNWDEEPLGKESDASIAKRLDVHLTIVRRARRSQPVRESPGWPHEPAHIPERRDERNENCFAVIRVFRS